QRIAYALMKATSGSRAVIIECHVFNFPATLFGHLVEQEPVHRTTDAKTKHASVGMLLHFRDDLHVVAHIAVGHKADDAHVVLRIGGIQCGSDSCHHFCST